MSDNDTHTQKLTLDSVAEWSVAKIIARYVTPISLAGLGWFALQMYGSLKEADLVAMDRDTTIEKRIIDSERGVTATQKKITETLSDIQSTLSAVRATANAQYQELKSDVQDNTREIDRLEDRLENIR